MNQRTAKSEKRWGPSGVLPPMLLGGVGGKFNPTAEAIKVRGGLKRRLSWGPRRNTMGSSVHLTEWKNTS